MRNSKEEWMNMNKEKSALLLTVVFWTCISVTLLANACALEYSAQPVPQDVLIEDVYRGQFVLEGNPRVRNPANLVFKMAPTVDLPGTTITLVIPDTVSVITGNTTWKGDVKNGQPIELKLSFQVQQAGEWQIVAIVRNSQFAGFDRDYFVILSSNATEGEIKTRSPDRTPPSQIPLRKRDVTPTKPSLPQTSIPQANTTVFGAFEYQTNDQRYHSVRFAKVELWEDMAFSPDNLLGTTSTDQNGYYQFGIDISGSKKIYVKIWCENSIAKCTGGWPYNVYYGESTHDTVYSGSYSFGTLYFDSTYDNWEAFDYVIDEFNWIKNNGNGWTRSQIRIEWPSGHCQNQSGQAWPCFDTGTDAFYLPDQQTGYSWQRWAVLHEYAHAIMYIAYGGSLPGGCNPSGDHYLNTESCEGFAITEGFAEFIQSAVDNNPGNTSSSNPCNGRVENIEDNNWELGRSCANTNGAIVEGAVASIWWDIFDSNNRANGDPDDDSLSLGFDEIWNVMATDKPTGINSFWDAWFRHYAYDSEMSDIYRSHGINRSNPNCFTLSTSTSPGGGGSITANPSPNCTGGYTLNTVVTLTANPNSGYRFESWSGSQATTNNPTTITMNQNKSMTANFSYVGNSDTTPPTTGWNSPSNGATITNRYVLLSAWAQDNSGGSGINRVAFSAKFNNQWIGLYTDYASPYEYNWDMCASGVPDGDIELGLEAVDNAGNKYVYSQHYTNIHINKSYNCGQTGSTWSVDYWMNKYLAGYVNWHNNESGEFIFRDWGDGSPGDSIPVNEWSARYVRTAYFPGGDYRFHCQHDDGCKIFIDGQERVNGWWDSSFDGHDWGGYISPGNHEIKVEYYDNQGGARLEAWWQGPGFLPRDQDCDPNQWCAEYWGNRNLSGTPAIRRNEGETLYHDWGSNGPDPMFPTDNFSARWTRTIYFPTGQYRFHITHDDGARLFIDDVQRIDAWGTCCVENTVDVSLTNGNHVIKMEMAENGGAANARLWWDALAQVPSTPTNFRVSSTTPSSITLAWDDTSNETGYKIYKWGWDGTQWTFIYLAPTSQNVTSYTDNGLNCASDYFYEVSAYNGVGESQHTGWIMGTTQSCPSPAMPSNLRVSNTTDIAITLAWDDNSNNESGFNIYRWGWNGSVWAFIYLNSVSANITTFTNTPLDCATDYYY